MRVSMLCPHCKCKAIIRSTETLSILSRKQFLQCQNLECGHTFTMMTTVHETMSPSRCPDENVFIPLSPYTRRSVGKPKLNAKQTA